MLTYAYSWRYKNILVKRDSYISQRNTFNLFKLQEKRSSFPRLYFLSDDDLLELLGQARAGAEGRETVLQSHLKKLFPGITGVHLGPGELSITSLCSHFGETFQLQQPVDIDCSVEVCTIQKINLINIGHHI